MNKFPVPQATVEAGLLHNCSNMAQWLEVAQFSSDDFTAHRGVFLFIQDYLRQYNSIPSSNQISTRFEWQPPVGDFAYWLEEMKRYVMARRVMEIIQKGYDEIAEPTKALNYLLDNLSMVRSMTTNHIRASDFDITNRLEKYQERQERLFRSNEMVGLRTGHAIIDSTRIGWIPGSLVGSYARPGIGKTWWLLWQGVMSWMDGKTILAITPEMPANWLNLRLDTVLCNELGMPINYTQLLLGDPAVQANYERATQVIGQSQRWWTYDSLNDQSIGLAELNALVRQHQPDLVLIDGVSLMRLEGNGQTWEKMRETIYGLKTLATVQENVIIVTHQAVNSARGQRRELDVVGRGDDFHMPSLNDAAYGDSFVQACSDIITFCAEPNTRHVNWFSIRKSRERGYPQDLAPRMAMLVDFGRGYLQDRSAIGYNPELIAEEVRRTFGAT